MKKLTILKLVSISLLFEIIFCIPTLAATNADDFLNSIHSAKALSLGLSLGMMNNLDAALLNPAELYVKSLKSQALLSYSNDFTELQKIQLGYSLPIQYSPFRFGVMYIGQQVTNIPEVVKNSTDPEIIGNFEAKNEAVKLLSAYQINQNLCIGANLFVLRETIKTLSGTGFGADVGLVYKLMETENLKLDLSSSLRNISFSGFKVPIQWDGKDYTDAIPAKFQTALGLSSQLLDNPTKISLGFTTEANHIKLTPNVGINYSLMHNKDLILDFRGGLNDSTFTLGLGMDCSGFEIDYAFMQHDYLGNINKISLKLDF